MKHEIDYTEFIERYLKDNMSLEEKTWFEKEIEGNHVLQEELNFHRKVDSVLFDKETIELQAQLDLIHDEIKETSLKGKTLIKRIYKRAYLATGVMAAIAMFLVFHSSSRDYSNEKLIGLFYQPAEASISYRSNTDSKSLLEEAMTFYEKKEYNKAIKLFEDVLQNDVSKIGVNLYSGISKMEIEEFSSANKNFQTIIDQKPNPFVESATWYLGLCYLFTNEREKARESFIILIDADGYYKNDAKKLLRHL